MRSGCAQSSPIPRDGVRLARLVCIALVLAVPCYSQSGIAAEESRIEAAQATASSVATVGGEAATFQSAEDFLREAKKFLASGLYLEAADLFETVLTYKDAKHLWPEATLLAGKSYLKAAIAIDSDKLRNEAIERFKVFEKSFPDSPLMEQVSYFWGLALFDLGDWFEAEPRFLELLNRFPESQFAPDSEYHLGRIMEKAQKYLEAQKRYYKVIEYYRRPAKDVEDSTFRIARISELIGKHDLAVKWYLLACKRNRTRCLMDSDVLFYCGNAYYALGQPGEAAKQMWRFVNIFPSDPRYDDAMLMLASSLSALDDLKGAAVVLAGVFGSSRPEKRAEAQLRLAELEQRTGKKLSEEGFMALYKKIVDETPYSDQAIVASLHISKEFLKDGDLRSCLRYVDWFFATFDQNKFTNEMLDVRDEAILGLLQSHLNEKEYFAGAMLFERRKEQIRRQSSVVRARFLAGQVYFGLMGYRRSASLLNATEDRYLSPDDRRMTRLLLALESYFEGSKEKAVSELEKLAVGKVDDISFTARYRLIDILLRENKVTEALERYQKLSPKYSDTRFVLCLDFRAGLMLFSNKQYAAAKEAFDRYLRFNVHSRELLRAALGGTGESAAAGEPAEEIKPLDCRSYLATAAYLQKARCSASLGQKDDAISLLEQVVDECQQSPLVYQACCFLADLKVQQGKSAEATKMLKKCEQLKAEEDVFKEAQSLLLSEMEMKRRLEDISSWWVDEK
ncbi:MAG TPA: tetratricopeptide repeat protein [bacterium]|nr:tetratricopeptide repeat protein [bacterium]